MDQVSRKSNFKGSETYAEATCMGGIFFVNFTSKMYIDTLNECLIETANVDYPDGSTLQEDNLPIHRSKLSK